MHDTYMTITGNVVDNPTLRRTKNGHLVANFRVASTPRRFDRQEGEWVDCDTLYVQVTAWRHVADHVEKSIFRGQPVVVFGRYCQHEYRVDDQLRTAYDLEAVSLGHDISRGVSSFLKAPRVAAGSVEADAEGRPVDATANYLDLAEDDLADDDLADDELPDGTEVDLVTGEVRELLPA